MLLALSCQFLSSLSKSSTLLSHVPTSSKSLRYCGHYLKLLSLTNVCYSRNGGQPRPSIQTFKTDEIIVQAKTVLSEAIHARARTQKRKISQSPLNENIGDHSDYHDHYWLPWLPRGPEERSRYRNRYGLDGPGIESRWGGHSPYPPRLDLGPTQPHVKLVPGFFRRVKRPGRAADHAPHLAPRLKKGCSHTSTPSLGFRGLF
jgi:hypothetical protein